MERKKGFTLIELLVVVSIIALLVSILLPALGKAREQAKAVACQSNLKQMNLGMIYYAENNEDHTMIFSNERHHKWYNYMAPFLGQKKDFATPPLPYDQGSMEILICPSTKKHPNPNPGEELPLIPGTSKTTYVFYGHEQSSYGINQWLLPRWAGDYGDIKILGDLRWAYESIPALNPANGNYYGRYSKAGSETPIFCDSMWVSSWPLDTNSPPANLDGDPDNIYHNPPRFMMRFCIDRHNKAINVGFVDSHVEKVPLEDLWRLKWHRNFVPRDMVIPGL